MEIININLVKKLIKAGLNEKEALVYISVLELGGAFPSRVAKYAGLRRSTTYNILTTLSIRGFVNEIKNKDKIFYQTEKPENILKFVKEKLNQAEESVNQILETLPEIKNIFNSFQNQPKITYYSGRKEIFSIFDDMVDNQKPYDMLCFSNGKEVVDVLHPDNDDIFISYVKRKEKKGITTRLIMPDTIRDRNSINDIYGIVSKKFKPTVRYINNGKLLSTSDITIYGKNKVAIINFQQGNETGVIIEDQAIHDMMKTIFELSWDSRQLKD